MDSRGRQANLATGTLAVQELGPDGRHHRRCRHPYHMPATPAQAGRACMPRPPQSRPSRVTGCPHHSLPPFCATLVGGGRQQRGQSPSRSSSIVAPGPAGHKAPPTPPAQAGQMAANKAPVSPRPPQAPHGAVHTPPARPQKPDRHQPKLVMRSPGSWAARCARARPKQHEGTLVTAHVTGRAGDRCHATPVPSTRGEGTHVPGRSAAKHGHRAYTSYHQPKLVNGTPRTRVPGGPVHASTAQADPGQPTPVQPEATNQALAAELPTRQPNR